MALWGAGWGVKGWGAAPPGGTLASLGDGLSWGYGDWGLTAWGGVASDEYGEDPRIVARDPAPGALAVSESAVITIKATAFGFGLDPLATRVYIDDVLVYNGAGGLTLGVTSAGYLSHTRYFSEQGILKLYKVDGWALDTVVKVTAHFADTAGTEVQDQWTWTTVQDLACYTGTQPLPIETALLTPFTDFLEVEPLRKALLSVALRTQRNSTPNALNKAARAVYQLAFSTELSTVLNKYDIRNEKALDTQVCERCTYLEMETALKKVPTRVLPAITSLRTAGVVPPEKASSFIDYLDSTSYLYRTSVLATVVLLAKSEEIRRSAG